MSKFLIRTIDAQGAPHEEIQEAPDQVAIYEDFKNKGVTLVSIEEKKAKTPWSITMPWERVSMRDKITFSRNLGAMVEAGLAVSRALTVIQKQTRGKKFKGIIGDLNTQIAGGKALSQALSDFPKTFPSLMVSMVKAGEESGSLAQSLRIVALQMENTYNLTRKIRGALMYPSIVLSAMVVIAFFMMTYVVPILAETFKSFNAALPIQTQIIINTSDFMRANLILVIVLFVGCVVGLVLAKRSETGGRVIETTMLHLPVIGGLIKEINAARTARTLSSLLSSGVDFLVAVRITTEVVQNSHYKKVLKQVEQKVEKGEPIAAVFGEHENLYPAFVGEMVSVGEETGQLSQMLLGVAVFYENDVDQKTKDMSAIVEPVLMIVIGLAVGVFAVAIISPIYSLSSAIS